jgi:ferrous iron transport protein B
VTGFIAKEVVVATLSTVYVGPADEPPPAQPDLLADLGQIAASFVSATWDTLRAVVSLLPGVDLFGPGDEGPLDAALVSALRASFTPLSAVSFCVFVLLTVPCVVTISALRQEFGPRWAAFSIGQALIVSWTAAVLVYQLGCLLGLT